jgi:hypothetical protein
VVGGRWWVDQVFNPCVINARVIAQSTLAIRLSYQQKRGLSGLLLTPTNALFRPPPLWARLWGNIHDSVPWNRAASGRATDDPLALARTGFGDWDDPSALVEFSQPSLYRRQ